MPTLFTPLQAMQTLPSFVAAMLRMTPAPEGTAVDVNFWVLGLNRTNVFGLTPVSAYQIVPSGVTVIP
jgi:hypothetical protein